MGNLAEAPGQIHDGVDRTSSTLSEKNQHSFPGMPFLDGAVLFLGDMSSGVYRLSASGTGCMHITG